MATTIFRQGGTTTITMDSSISLDGYKIKAGFYSSSGKPLFETIYINANGDIAADTYKAVIHV